jgi:hypothetical protein
MIFFFQNYFYKHQVNEKMSIKKPTQRMADLFNKIVIATAND